jgi:GNAT-family acetyltransferase (TIGR03103 family)
MEAAIASAGRLGGRVLLEQYVKGEDVRIVLINYEVVAAAVRRPPRITGTGKHTIAQLIERQSQRRARLTGGESRIPLDGETKRCLKEHGYVLADILPKGQAMSVRKTANLHTGGTIHDVTAKIHPDLAATAVIGAEALAIPVVGFDFIVENISQPHYVIIEANERPGLANHEPQPTAERFIDLLFPQTKTPTTFK